MSIVDLVTDAPTGLVDVSPQFIYLDTKSTQDQITTAGYLNNNILSLYGDQITRDQIVIATTSDAPTSVYNINIDPTTQVITLSLQGGGGGDGNVSFLPPVSANRLAVFTDNIGTIGDPLNTTAVHIGDIQLGSSGNAGKLISFPPTPGKGSFTFQAVDNVSGNFNITIVNDGSYIGMSFNTLAVVPYSGYSTYKFLVSNYFGEQLITNGSLSLSSGDFTVYSGRFFKCLSSTPDMGGLLLYGTNNNGNYQVKLTNFPFSQNTTFNLPDPGTSQSSFIITTWPTNSTQQIVSGNLQVAAGNLIAGGGGGGGSLISYPPTAASGSLQLAATNNTAGNFATVITNANNISAHATYTIPNTFQPDNGIVVTIGQTPFNPKHMVRASSSTLGPIIEDAGAAFFSGSASNSGGSATLVFNVTDCTPSSKIIVTILSSANVAFIVSAMPDVGTITVNFNSNPGAVTIFYMGTTDAITLADEVVVENHNKKLTSSSGALDSVIEDAGAALFSGDAFDEGGGSVITFPAAGCTTSSKINVTVGQYTNLSFVLSATPGNGTVTVTFTTDPGQVDIFYIGTTGTVTLQEEEKFSKNYLSSFKNSFIKFFTSKRRKKWLIF